MTIRMHRSTDRGAPVMSGQQGKMNEVLLATLVKGFPATAIGVNLDSSTGDHTAVTVNMPNSGFIVGQTITVSGANEPEYNGNFTVTAVNATYVFYTKVGSASYSSGTITVAGQRTVTGTPTLTRSGTTVTVALTAHGFVVGNRAFIQGANEPAYNGWKTVATQTDANTFTFELPASATPATPATGTILVRYGEAGLGWTMPFSGTNKGIYRQGVKDDRVQGVLIATETTTTVHSYGAGLEMAEDATALSTYVGLPYATEGADYTGILKSGTVDATARKWIVLGDHRTVIILTQPNAAVSVPLGWSICYFGDFVSYLPGDRYPILSGAAYRYPSYTFASLSQSATLGANATYGSSGLANYAMAMSSADDRWPLRTTRTHLGASGAIQVAFLSTGIWAYYTDNAGRVAFGYKSATYATDLYPDPVHGGLNLDKVRLLHAPSPTNTGNSVIRGEVRGLWNPLQRRAQVSTLLNNDTFSGTGELAGKTFEMFDVPGDPLAWFVVETSDTWSV